MKNFPDHFYPDDTFIVSYPKSGNTWLLFLIGNYLTDCKVNFQNRCFVIPDLHYNPQYCSFIPRPRFMKSHLPHVPEFQRVIYLVRDGRDVAVSYYFHCIKFGIIKNELPFKDFLKRFNEGSIDLFGNWANHVNSWLDNKPGNFLLVRYEDMKKDTVTELKRILDFAGISADPNKIQSAIEASSFERMQHLEQIQYDEFKKVGSINANIHFVRSGKVGESHIYFTDDLMKEFIRVHGTALKRLNYLNDDSTINSNDPYDIAYEWGWRQPQLRDLIYLCYKTPDFSDNARRYFMSPEFHEAVRILSELGKSPHKGIKVLDFGCGNGVACYALARIGYSVVGVDSSLGKLAGINAAKKIQGLDGVNFELVHTTGEKIDFPDNSFDIVWIREALHHIMNLIDFLTEIKRVLKPDGIVCCLRDVVIWNESQRAHFFATHPFNHITKDEGCYYLEEYLSAFDKAGLSIEKVLYPHASIINTYPDTPNNVLAFDEALSKQRKQGYDLFSFFARKLKTDAITTQTPPGLQGSHITIGKDVQIIGLKNIYIGNGSCIGDSAWLNVCIRDDVIRMKIGKCVLIGRQAVISTAGYLEIGDYCVLAPRVFVSDADHIFSDIYLPIIQQGTTNNRTIIIEENCWLGMHVVVTGNVVVGRGSVIAANAVVTKDVPPFTVVAGVPAKIIKMYNPQTKEWERVKDQVSVEKILEIRKSFKVPGRSEYARILEKNAQFRDIGSVLAGKGISI